MPIDRNTAQYITGNPQQPTQSSAPGIWDMDEQGSAQASGRWPLPPNVIQRSLRFNVSDGANLSRTPATASNRKTWTWSGWVKRGLLGGVRTLISTNGTTDNTLFQFEFNGDALRLAGNATQWAVTTSLYRDPSAWYHIVLATDTTQATASDRFKIYVNGIIVTAFSATSYPAQNADLGINDTRAHYIGQYWNNTPSFDGYMAEINFVDGQALTPSSFGQTDAQTGQWIPMVYSGSYGTNGFRLQFLDNSGTTATTLGKDTSGMGNNWTPSGSPGFSVASGSGNDSLRDVPMNYYSIDNGLGGEVIGNYCTWNPLDNQMTLANGNLDASSGTANRTVRATYGISSGKWYWEVLMNGSPEALIGVAKSTASLTGYLGSDSSGYGYDSVNGNKYNGGSGAAYGLTFTTGDIIGIALDLDSATTTLSFYKNGVSQGVAYSSLTGPLFPSVSAGAINATMTVNFGQRPFAYTAPSGFKALCTQNLPWSGTITTSGTFTGNASTDGPFVYLNGIPTAMTINGNAVTFGTQADKLSNGFKVRSSSASYNTSGSNTYSVSTTGNQFSKANAQANP